MFLTGLKFWIDEGNTIILKRLQEEYVRSRVVSLMKNFADEFKKAGITQEDLAREIKAARR